MIIPAALIALVKICKTRALYLNHYPTIVTWPARAVNPCRSRDDSALSDRARWPFGAVWGQKPVGAVGEAMTGSWHPATALAVLTSDPATSAGQGRFAGAYLSS